MTIFKHEWRRGYRAWLIWTASIGLLVILVNLIWPDMADSTDSWTSAFQGLGAFGAAFGLDFLDLGDFLHFYGLEAMNILGIGGALYAAITGMNSIAAEEGKHTAEFLFSHPVSRSRVLSQKLTALLSFIMSQHLLITGGSLLSIRWIGESIDLPLFFLFHLGLMLLSLQIALICFGLSACLSQENLGLGIGLALLVYTLNIVGNMSDTVESVRYLTPFAYAEPSDVLLEGRIDLGLLLPQLAGALLVVFIGWRVFLRRDLRA